MSISYNPPIFIIGNPRSGTSMFRLMLTSHQNLAIAPESGFMLWWKNKYSDWSVEDNTDRLDEFISDLFTSRRFEYWELKESEVKSFIKEQQPMKYSELISLVYMLWAKKIDKEDAVWGDKNNYYLNHIPELNELYPDAKFIHIIRDGRDVATSYMKLSEIKNKVHLAPNLPDEIAVIAKEWTSNISTILASLSRIENEKYTEIRYEDLISNPELELKRICQFLNLVYDESMLGFNEYNRKHNLEPKDYMSWKAETYKKLNSDAVGKWKSILSLDQIAIFEKIAKEPLNRFNYL